MLSLYLIDVVSKLQDVLIGMCIISIIALFTLSLSFESEEERKQKRKMYKFCIICTIFCFLFYIFVPSKETLTQILIGG